ncbi:MAG: hypothetical protein ACK4GL_12750 [Flavobacteriales bacterium]
MASIITIVRAQTFIDLESGLILTGYNEVRIPGSGGTRFSLSKDFNTNPDFFYRIRAGYSWNERHTVLGLFAPLTLYYNGIADRPIDFAGLTYAQGSEIEASYRFNSYRLTYRYDFLRKPKFEFGLGFTAKIRDAEIALSGGEQTSSKVNVGFVPIINLRANWLFHKKWSLLVDGDALGASQGRAVDMLLATTYYATERIMLRLGYRILEGGADNRSVYNFSLFHYLSFGITLRL